MGQSSLWVKIGQIGLAALDEFEASEAREKLGHTLGPSVSAARSAQEMIKALCAHVEQLEKRLDEQGRAYKGIWKPGTYSAGSFVTHAGSMWHADTATSFKPGEGGGWTLAVKKGTDAK
jgi:hypothetical protein